MRFLPRVWVTYTTGTIGGRSVNQVLFRAVIATAAAGSASGFGALALALWGDISRSTYSTILGFSAGVMLALSSLVLLPHAAATGSVPSVLAGLVLGGMFVMGMEYLLPHIEPHFGGRDFSPGLEDAVLLTVAVAIHNIPEGLAMGLGYVVGKETMGPQLALAVAIQNIPEGLAISLPLRRNGVNRWLTVAFATLSGMSEVVGAVLGVLGAAWLSGLLPLGLSFAAGALIYVTADQLIPEAHDSTALPSWGVTAGFALVLLIGWYTHTAL